MPRKTESSNPRDWLILAAGDLDGVRLLVINQVAYAMAASKLAEVQEKIMKAELIRQGWFLVTTHDLVKLVDELHHYDRDLAARMQPLAESLAESYFAHRYPGFDVMDPDWPAVQLRLQQVADLLECVSDRLS